MDLLKKILAKDLKDFLEEYGKIKADYDPEYDEEYERFSSPDASELLYASERLSEGHDLERYPWSEFGSGGYVYSSEVSKKHDALLDRVKPFVKR